MQGCAVSGYTLKQREMHVLSSFAACRSQRWACWVVLLRCKGLYASSCMHQHQGIFIPWSHLFCGDSMVLQHFDENERVCEPLQ